MSARSHIKHGNEFPFDASDAWWNDSGEKPPKPGDWSQSAARGVIASLQDRGGIKHELCQQNIDEETRREIVEEIASIIRYAVAAK